MTKRKTRAELERKLVEMEAQLASTYHFSGHYLSEFTTDKMTGSGVLIQMSSLGGRIEMNPVVIRDGLSNETIEALKKDMRRSFELATMYRPL